MDAVVEYIYFSGSCQRAGSCMYYIASLGVQHSQQCSALVRRTVNSKRTKPNQTNKKHILAPFSLLSVWAPPFIISVAFSWDVTHCSLRVTFSLRRYDPRALQVVHNCGSKEAKLEEQKLLRWKAEVLYIKLTTLHELVLLIQPFGFVLFSRM